MSSVLKIRIKVFWDKDNSLGEVFGETVCRYFYTGDLSIQQDKGLTIPVECRALSKYNQISYNKSNEYLSVCILLADHYMRYHDRERNLATQLIKKTKESKKFLYIPVALNDEGCKYIGNTECITTTSRDCDSIDSIRSKEFQKIADEVKPIAEETEHDFFKNILMVLQRIMERIAGRYFYLTKGTNSERLGIFICHTKSTGAKEVDALNAYLSTRTTSDSFVDKNSILLGEELDEIILNTIEYRGMIVLLTDNISTRDWCIREVNYAKQKGTPIIIVDALQNRENAFMMGSLNCPVIKLKSNTDKNYNLIMELLVNEVLYNLQNMYSVSYPKNTKVLPRKIELSDLFFLEDSYNKIIYPEPLLTRTEKSIIELAVNKLKKKISFETNISAYTKKFYGYQPKVFISSSSHNDTKQRITFGCCNAGINYAIKQLTKYLIYMGCTILNAGNLEENGYNKILLDQYEKYSKLENTKANYKFYVNPFYNGSQKLMEFKSHYCTKELSSCIEFVEFKQKYKNFNMNLDFVRKKISEDTDMQIVIGGMYKENEITGIDKEVEMCINNHKSIFLLGGFGFKAKLLCKKYINKENYKKLNNGLSLRENIILANSYEIKNILYLIFKGWSKVLSSK